MTDSPVSMVEEPARFPVLDPEDDPHNQPKFQPVEETATTLESTENQPEHGQAMEQPKPVDAADFAKKEKEKDKQKRYTIHAALFGDKGNHGTEEKKLKKARRRTLSLTKNDEPQKLEHECEAAEASAEAKSDGTTDGTDSFTAHPAVRPFSLIVPDGSEGKEKEVLSAPVYGRCSCCGRMRKPPGFSRELSPVMENENLRTNFSFEVERTTGPSGTRSSDASRNKFTPIIPMEVALNETRQASIEPYYAEETQEHQRETPSSVIEEIAQCNPVRQPLAQMATSPIRNKRHSGPPRFVRFASLHGKRNSDTDAIAEAVEEDEVEVDGNTPLRDQRHDLSNHGAQMQEFGTMSEEAAVEDKAARRQLVMETSSASRVVFEPAPAMTVHAHNPASERSSMDTFHTPAGGTTPASEQQTFPPTQSHFTVSRTHQPQPVLEPSFFRRVTAPAPPQTYEPSPVSSNGSPTTAILSTSPNTSISPSSAFEQELSASFLSPTDRVDFSLRPKFSFESARSAMNAVERVIGHEEGNGNGKEKSGKDISKDVGKDRPTGKRKSMGRDWLVGMTVKA